VADPKSERPFPSFAYLLGLTVFVVLVVLAISAARRTGEAGFFGPADPRFFRVVARNPLAAGRAFAHLGGSAEASYRYGRVGFPLLAWFAAGGNAAWVGWSLIGVNLVAIAAVPFLSAFVLEDLGLDPRLGALTLLAPGLLLVYDRPYAEPLAIALVLGALLFVQRSRFGFAITLLAVAVCTREVCALVVVAWCVRDFRDARPRAFRWLLALVPYAAWTVWVRVRVGQLPFLANTPTRRDAIRPPFGGCIDGLTHSSGTMHLTVIVCVATAMIGVGAGWRLRRSYLGSATLALSVLALTLGPNALRYLGDSLRVLALPQVFAILAAVVALAPSSQPARVDGTMTAALGH
jgi:hypothetical protein